MPRRAHLAAVAVLLASLLIAACSDDGRELAPPRPDQTTTTTTAPPDITGDATTAFALSSEAFADGAELPTRFTCFDAGTSPPLSWANAPAAAELALVVRDRDAGGYVHWIVTGIDPVVTGFGEGGVPEGAAEQVNTEGSLGWLPACPPEDDGRHIYDFVLHALAEPVSVDPAMPADEVASAIESASIATAPLAATVTPTS